MARPKKCRRVCGRPAHSCFKPNGVPMNQLKQVELLSEEFEALRLADQLDLSQQEAADQMGVSRQTFGNIVKKARFKVATCLVEGNALVLAEPMTQESNEVIGE
ncbi:DUF134 domain-containing protein [Vibrio tapetis]|uniref:UPF0251 protein VTAP4600_B1429 n=2 Tax=Vibrio tapetis TaxID=52443 RepID=A0A2N8ZMB2_9VIBR|nr:DUF134 domain-containing protein [Vibrio tapetis]SON53040.1 conserved protein of unknown function [Vibrio tapetis subsp. tapetis]